MQLYCLVKDGKVSGPFDIEGKNPERLKMAGFLPAVIEKPESFDDRTEIWGTPEYTVLPDAVHVLMVKRQKTAQETSSFEAAKEQARQAALSEVDGLVRDVISLLNARKLTEAHISALLSAIKNPTQKPEQKP